MTKQFVKWIKSAVTNLIDPEREDRVKALAAGVSRGLEEEQKGFRISRFGRGMMNPELDTFFSDAFVFELEPMPELTEAVVKDEFLKYYRLTSGQRCRDLETAAHDS